MIYHVRAASAVDLYIVSGPMQARPRVRPHVEMLLILTQTSAQTAPSRPLAVPKDLIGDEYPQARSRWHANVLHKLMRAAEQNPIALACILPCTSLRIREVREVLTVPVPCPID